MPNQDPTSQPCELVAPLAYRWVEAESDLILVKAAALRRVLNVDARCSQPYSCQDRLLIVCAMANAISSQTLFFTFLKHVKSVAEFSIYSQKSLCQGWRDEAWFEAWSSS